MSDDVVLTFYPGGLTAGIPGPGSQTAHKRGGSRGGWTRASAAGNQKFLMSVDPSRLTGIGFVVTLTVGKCPPTPEQWNDLIDLYIRRLRRTGIIRYHWVTEMQRRRVPHTHIAVWFTFEFVNEWTGGKNFNALTDINSKTANGEELKHRLTSFANAELLSPWMDLPGVRDLDTGWKGQHYSVLCGRTEHRWFKYQSKHVIRSANHYQRDPASLPPEWAGVTGRMWARGLDWPTVKPRKFLVKNPPGTPAGTGWLQFRRVLKKWAVSTAKTSITKKLSDKFDHRLTLPTASIAEGWKDVQSYLNTIEYAEAMLTNKTLPNLENLKQNDWTTMADNGGNIRTPTQIKSDTYKHASRGHGINLWCPIEKLATQFGLETHELIDIEIDQ